jgi:hypothetical protein
MDFFSEVRRRREELGLGMFEELDLRIFKKHVPKSYSPQESPVAMAVGAFSVKEGSVIRAFHKDQFGKGCRVFACNPRIVGRTEDYDYTLSGQMEGDARGDYAWDLPFLDLEIPLQPYDFVYIRNPDLIDIPKWGSVFRMGIERLAETGILATIIRESDSTKYNRLKDHLNQRYQIVPMQPDQKIDTPSMQSFYDTISFFGKQ